MTPQPKQWQNSDLPEAKQIIYHSKGIPKSYRKMYIFVELEPLCKKLWTFFCQILALFIMPIHQIWSCQVAQDVNFNNFLLCPNTTINITR